MTAASISSFFISVVTRSRMAFGSLLLCFMMFLQILADLFAQTRARAMQHDGDDHLRCAEQLCDLSIVVTLEVAKREDRGGLWAKFGDGLPDQLVKLSVSMLGLGARCAARHFFSFTVLKIEGWIAAAASEHIEGCVGGGAHQI